MLSVCYNKAVLIETYWNVNASAEGDGSASAAVLIETYWNVNETLSRAFSPALFSLNRNILECKYFQNPCGRD